MGESPRAELHASPQICFMRIGGMGAHDSAISTVPGGKRDYCGWERCCDGDGINGGGKDIGEGERIGVGDGVRCTWGESSS